MPENNSPALDKDIAELIRLQKKQLIHQRIHTVLSVIAIIAVIALAVTIAKMVPDTLAAIKDARELIGEVEELLEGGGYESGYNSMFEGFNWLEGLFH